MRGFATVLGPILAILVISGSVTAMAVTSPRGSSGDSVGTTLETDAIALAEDSTVAPLPPATMISLTLTLANPHAAERTQFLTQLENPFSPTYRHFVTFAQYVERFSPPASTVASVESVLAHAGGLDITASPDRTTVSAVLSAAEIEQLLGTHLVTYGDWAGMSLYTAEGAVSLPEGLQGLVTGVGGLSNLATAELRAEFQLPNTPIPRASARPTQFVYAPALGENWFVGSDFTQAYGATQLFPGAGSVANATYPTSVSIATLLVSAYNITSNTNLPPWDPAVVNAYFNSTLSTTWPISTLTGVPVSIPGQATPPLPGSFGSQNDSTEYEVENSLDLEMAGSLAPGAPLYNFYFAASAVASSATNGDVADYLADDLEAALSYPSYGSAPLAVISCSFGIPDAVYSSSSWDALLTEAALLGVTIVSASGDQGNAPDALSGRPDGQWPVWPASDASNTSGAVSVGGVSINLTGTPTSSYNGTELNLSYDDAIGELTQVSAWYDTGTGEGAVGGTEGGVSTAYPEPWWQLHSAAQPAIVNATITEGASTIGRAEPDLAMPANSTIATISANSTGAIFFTILEGTSIAAPVFAGLLADVVAVEHNSSGGGSKTGGLGFIDPEVYNISSYYAAHPASAGDPFTDVPVGHNYVFRASSGWDPLTGWGEVDAVSFLAADRNATLTGYQYSGPTPLLPQLPSSSSGGAPVPWSLIFVIFGVGIVVAIVLVVLAARPSRPKTISTGIPPGAQWGGPGYPSPPPPAGPSLGSTFLCPYCGAIRPAEPVRCPQCGAF